MSVEHLCECAFVNTVCILETGKIEYSLEWDEKIKMIKKHSIFFVFKIFLRFFIFNGTFNIDSLIFRWFLKYELLVEQAYEIKSKWFELVKYLKMIWFDHTNDFNEWLWKIYNFFPVSQILFFVYLLLTKLSSLIVLSLDDFWTINCLMNKRMRWKVNNSNNLNNRNDSKPANYLKIIMEKMKNVLSQLVNDRFVFLLAHHVNVFDSTVFNRT